MNRPENVRKKGLGACSQEKTNNPTKVVAATHLALLNNFTDIPYLYFYT
jgi:hypothetical protein